jgi:hypothetical protein
MLNGKVDILVVSEVRTGFIWNVKQAVTRIQKKRGDVWMSVPKHLVILYVDDHHMQRLIFKKHCMKYLWQSPDGWLFSKSLHCLRMYKLFKSLRSLAMAVAP